MDDISGRFIYLAMFMLSCFLILYIPTITSITDVFIKNLLQIVFFILAMFFMWRAILDYL